jgi:hypothetical protein
VSTIGGHKGPVFYDADAVPKQEVTVKPIEEQSEWESRRLWQKVADGIRGGDYEAAGKEKSIIEVVEVASHSGAALPVTSELRLTPPERAEATAQGRGRGQHDLAPPPLHAHREDPSMSSSRPSSTTRRSLPPRTPTSSTARRRLRPRVQW